MGETRGMRAPAAPSTGFLAIFLVTTLVHASEGNPPPKEPPPPLDAAPPDPPPLHGDPPSETDPPPTPDESSQDPPPYEEPPPPPPPDPPALSAKFAPPPTRFWNLHIVRSGARFVLCRNRSLRFAVYGDEASDALVPRANATAEGCVETCASAVDCRGFEWAKNKRRCVFYIATLPALIANKQTDVYLRDGDPTCAAQPPDVKPFVFCVPREFKLTDFPSLRARDAWNFNLWFAALDSADVDMSDRMRDDGRVYVAHEAALVACAGGLDAAAVRRAVTEWRLFVIRSSEVSPYGGYVMRAPFKPTREIAVTAPLTPATFRDLMARSNAHEPLVVPLGAPTEFVPFRSFEKPFVLFLDELHPILMEGRGGRNEGLRVAALMALRRGVGVAKELRLRYGFHLRSFLRDDAKRSEAKAIWQAEAPFVELLVSPRRSLFDFFLTKRFLFVNSILSPSI
jgi:hypothetical protein